MKEGVSTRVSLGCAFTPKALAYEEVNNRPLAILAAILDEELF